MIDEKKNSCSCSELAGSMQRALIVDNDKNVLASLSCALADYGLLVTICQSPAEALKRCAFIEYHYFVTDYNMPGMDGAELTKQLRKLYPRSIIIGMSGTDRNREFMHAGANDFLQKPFPPSDLARMLDNKGPHA